MSVAAPASAPLTVPAELRADLERCARARQLPHRLVVRAQVVLAAVHGESTYSIAKRIGCCESTVRKWRTRIEGRPCLAVLDDRPRSGRPAIVPPLIRCEIIQIACSRPKDHVVPFGELWTLKTLRSACEERTGWRLSTSEIQRILMCSGLRPHRVRSWLHSPDPQFQEKVKAITDLYLELPRGATLLSFDEKTGMQAREDKHPMRPAGPGGGVRKEFEYTRHGTVTLLAALDVRTGEVHGECARRTGENLVAFFETLAMKYPTGPVFVVLDNLNVHKGVRWETFNARHDGRFHFVYTPLHASWINQIEIWFSILQRRVIKHGSFPTQAVLTRTVLGFIAYWNRVEAHPFRWRFRDFERPTPLALVA
jgi:transposase